MAEQQSAQAILVFSLGPVQSFIETARRVQDLWVGSQLLSLLAREALTAAELQHAELVFPQRMAIGRWPQSVPNRVVVSVAEANVATVGKAMMRAASEKWKTIATIVSNEFASLAPQSGWETIWDTQIKNWLEVYWVAWQWDGRKETYATAYQNASLALGARKQLRHISVADELDIKCSLCGSRQALRTELASAEKFWEAIRSRVRPSELRRGERLCAVCAVKRFARKATVPELRALAYPSTSSIAAASFRMQLLVQWTPALRDAVKAHLDAVADLSLDPREKPEPFPFLENLANNLDAEAKRLLTYDGDYFYSDFWTEERVKEELNYDPQQSLPASIRNKIIHARATLSNLRNKCAQPGVDITPPATYFATLVMDGDRMGELLSVAAQSGIEAHRNISAALIEFSEQAARKIIEENHPGILVYGGGDDLLAFMPLAHALPIANELRIAFAERMRTVGFSDGSASAGIAISHHTQPLESALRAARTAEHRAKDKLDRNSLGVDVLRRSGERRELGSKWQHDNTAIVVLFNQVRELIRAGKLSGKLAYDVLAEVDGLANLPNDARRVELKRLLSRHRDRVQWSDAEFKNIAPTLLNQLVAFACNSQTDPAKQMLHLADWLTLARFLAQGGRE